MPQSSGVDMLVSCLELQHLGFVRLGLGIYSLASGLLALEHWEMLDHSIPPGHSLPAGPKPVNIVE